MAVSHYRQLIAWQKGMDAAEAVYALTKAFPADERFCLVNQLRRCAVSIPSNIAEGQGRRSASDFSRFLRIAMGSVQECETQLLIAVRLGYLTGELAQSAFALLEETGKLIRGLHRSVSPTDR